MRWLVGLAARAGHGDDVTLERIWRFRWACGGASLALLTAGVAAGTIGRKAAADFVRGLSREWRAWRPREHMRRTGALLRSPGTAYFAAFVLARVGGVVLRFRHLFRPMLYDEAYSFLNFARRPLYQALVDYNNTNNHLLNTGLMHLAYCVAGQTDWALRLPAFVAGVLTLPAGYFFARKTLGPAAALLGTALLATSPMLINYSVEARGYSMVALFGLWTADRLAAAISGGRRMDWLLATAAAAAGFYAVPTMAFPFAGCVAWGLAVCRLRKGSGVEGQGSEIRGQGSGVRDRESRAEEGTPERDAVPETSYAPVTPASVLLWSAWVLALTALLYLPAFVYTGTTAAEPSFVRPQDWASWLEEFPEAMSEVFAHFSRVPAWTAGRGIVILVAALAVTGFGAVFFQGLGVGGQGSGIRNRQLAGSRQHAVHRTQQASANGSSLPSDGALESTAHCPPPTAHSPASAAHCRLPAARWLFVAVPLVTVVLLVIARLAPPPRVLVFLAPWWLLLAGGGAAVVLRGLERWIRVRAETAAAVLAMAIVGAGAVFMFTHRVPYFREEKDLPRDVPAVAQYLAGRLQPGHRLLVLNPYDKPLEYYLVKHCVPLHADIALNGRPQPGETVWLVKPKDLSPREALKQIPSAQWAQHENLAAERAFLQKWLPVARWDRVDVWRCRAPGPAPPPG
ncbi:MAG: glycosyltransferase family 39 protein [Planctomycetes bacterium]|nr:glycosyltransferase family 39 protein [Planctomycetota bacterium]